MTTQGSWKSIGRRLKKARTALGIEETDAARIFGVTLRTYRRYEVGQPQRGLGFVKFCEQFKFSIDWLIDGSTRTPRHNFEHPNAEKIIAGRKRAEALEAAI